MTTALIGSGLIGSLLSLLVMVLFICLLIGVAVGYIIRGVSVAKSQQLNASLAHQVEQLWRELKSRTPKPVQNVADKEED